LEERPEHLIGVGAPPVAGELGHLRRHRLIIGNVVAVNLPQVEAEPVLPEGLGERDAQVLIEGFDSGALDEGDAEVPQQRRILLRGGPGFLGSISLEPELKEIRTLAGGHSMRDSGANHFDHVGNVIAGVGVGILGEPFWRQMIG
jgi:hypothetical protein